MSLYTTHTPNCLLAFMQSYNYLVAVIVWWKIICIHEFRKPRPPPPVSVIEIRICKSITWLLFFPYMSHILQGTFGYYLICQEVATADGCTCLILHWLYSLPDATLIELRCISLSLAIVRHWSVIQKSVSRTWCYKSWMQNGNILICR